MICVKQLSTPLVLTVTVYEIHLLNVEGDYFWVVYKSESCVGLGDSTMVVWQGVIIHVCTRESFL